MVKNKERALLTINSALRNLAETLEGTALITLHTSAKNPINLPMNLAKKVTEPKKMEN